MVQSEISLSDEYADILAEEIKQEIDAEVLGQILIENGWTEVRMRYVSREQAVDIIDWCIDTLAENQWKRLSGSFIFRNKKDAEWFMLRWL